LQIPEHSHRRSASGVSFPAIGAELETLEKVAYDKVQQLDVVLLDQELPQSGSTIIHHGHVRVTGFADGAAVYVQSIVLLVGGVGRDEADGLRQLLL